MDAMKTTPLLPIARLAFPMTARLRAMPTRCLRRDVAIPVLLALVAVVLAAVTYGRFLPVAEHLWVKGDHDRNAHYWLALFTRAAAPSLCR